MTSLSTRHRQKQYLSNQLCTLPEYSRNLAKWTLVLTPTADLCMGAALQKKCYSEIAIPAASLLLLTSSITASEAVTVYSPVDSSRGFPSVLTLRLQRLMWQLDCASCPGRRQSWSPPHCCGVFNPLKFTYQLQDTLEEAKEYLKAAQEPMNLPQGPMRVSVP